MTLQGEIKKSIFHTGNVCLNLPTKHVNITSNNKKKYKKKIYIYYKQTGNLY